MSTARRSAAGALLLVLLVVGWWSSPANGHALVPGGDERAVASSDGGAGDTSSESTSSGSTSSGSMSVGQAAALGVVEGVTEFLPVSSTGHLLVSQRLMDIGTTDADKEAADAYAVVIQLGAILAIVVLYWRRLWSLVLGLVGRDDDGRRVLIALVVAFVPAAVIGFVGEKAIKDVLFGAWPVVAAWFVGGVAVLVLVRTGLLPTGEPTADEEAATHEAEPPVHSAGMVLTAITPVQALIIGAAQCLAMWPGTSRSLVTIVAAALVGLRLSAAVEFSFLLGLATLSAATLFDLAKHGGTIVDTFGVAAPVVGFVTAALSAVVAVRWMVSYLQRHSLAIFGWYRIGVAVVVAGLLAAGTITS